MRLPRSIQNLIDEFSKLPTVGPKTAERYVFYLLKQKSDDLKKFASAIANLKNDIIICRECRAVVEQDPCLICQDQKRDRSLLCVVANTRDMISIENTKEYNGLYHVLGGVLSAIDGIEPSQLTIDHLLEKMKDPKKQIKEVILALNPNLDGETTSLYLIKNLRPFNVKMTRLARGLPNGSDLEYADELTLANALKYRVNQ